MVFLYTYFQENIKEMKVQNPEVKKKKKKGYSAILSRFKITGYILVDKPGQENLKKGYQIESRNQKGKKNTEEKTSYL